jgi:hypothetical protein
MTRRWLAGGAVLAAAALAGCGGGHKVSTPPTTTVSETTPTGPPAKCSSFGAAWLQDYNKGAVKTGSPIRMLSACCGPATKAGRRHCFLKLTLVGTKTIGCEIVDLGPDGTPATIGRHVNCALLK